MLNVFELSASLGLDSSGFESGLNSSGSKIEGLSAKTVAVGKVMADAFELVIQKVAEYGEKVIEVGEAQETALAKVNTIMDQSVVSTDQMNTAIKDLSSEMGVSVTELSDTVYNAISATGDTANAVALAGQASKLATAGFTDTSSALSVLTTAMNAYGLSADQAESISDSLIEVQNLGVTTVAELSSSMGKAIASASAYGVNLGNLESAYVSITKAGINTAEGTTYISSMLKELGDTGSDVSAVLQEQTGKSFDQLMAEGSSLGDVLGILSDSVDGDSTALMNLWSSAEAGKASSAIVGQGLETFNENLETIGNTAGATESAYETMADTLEHKTEVFKTTGENLMSAIYDGMSGNLGDIVSLGTDMLTKLSDTIETEGVGALPEALITMFSDGFQTVADYMPEAMDTVFSAIQGTITGLLENSSEIVDSVGGIIDSLLTALDENGPTIISEIEHLITSIANNSSEWLPILIPKVIQTLLDLTTAMLDNIDIIIQGALSLIQGLANGLIQGLPVLLEKAPEIIQKLCDAISENLPLILETGVILVAQLAVGIIQNLPQIIVCAFKIITSLVSGVGKYYSNLIKAGGDILKKVGEGIKAKIDEAKTWGKDLIDNFIQGIKDKIAKLKECVSNVAQTVKDFLGFSEPKEGPLSNFHTFAPDMMDLFAKGIRDNESTVRDQIAKSFDFGTVGTIEAKTSVSGSANGSESTQPQPIYITLQGDADRLFKLVQEQSTKYVRMTGQPAF